MCWINYTQDALYHTIGLLATLTFLCRILLILTMNFPAGREAIMSQLRVWPFPSTIIMTFGERNRNPGHHFAGISM